MEAQGNKQLLQGLVKNCLSPERLELKEDAMVMCTKNNFEAGYVNGTLARIIGFSSDGGFPIIKTTEGSSRLPGDLGRLWDLCGKFLFGSITGIEEERLLSISC